MGAPYTKSTIFRRAECTNKKLHFLRRSRLNYRVYIASADGASENFRVFCRMAAHDVMFSNSKGWGQVSLLALPAGDHDLFSRSTTCVVMGFFVSSRLTVSFSLMQSIVLSWGHGRSQNFFPDGGEGVVLYRSRLFFGSSKAHTKHLRLLWRHHFQNAAGGGGLVICLFSPFCELQVREFWRFWD